MLYKPLLTATILGSAALLAIGTPASAQQRSQRSNESVTHIDNDNDSIWLVGQVKDLDAQLPIANARVEIDGHPAHIRTNQDGKFYVRGTRKSKHTIAVRAMGYEPYTFDLTKAEQPNEPADVWMIRASGDSKHPHMTDRSGDKKHRNKTN